MSSSQLRKKITNLLHLQREIEKMPTFTEMFFVPFYNTQLDVSCKFYYMHICVRIVIVPGEGEN